MIDLPEDIKRNNWHDKQAAAERERVARNTEIVRLGVARSTDPRVCLGMMPCEEDPRFTEVEPMLFDLFLSSAHSVDFVKRSEAPAHYPGIERWHNIRALEFARQRNPEASEADHLVCYRAEINGRMRFFVWKPWVDDPFRK